MFFPELFYDLCGSFALDRIVRLKYADVGEERATAHFRKIVVEDQLIRDLIFVPRCPFVQPVETVSGVKFSESELIDAFSDTPVSFWLDSDTHCIVKLEMDLSRSADILFLGILSQALGTELDAGIDKAVMSFTVSSFDTVDEIVIPQEAKDALEEALSKE